ncbi:hypothetical protein PUR53_04865 [Streptomyces sp. SP18BB07]|nr:hypothetical protein [Streptomyces sp. SP18BB07]MEE1758416.1 hypothetical protein [Streptomyces sp. SP18BB07]
MVYVTCPTAVSRAGWARWQAGWVPSMPDSLASTHHSLPSAPAVRASSGNEAPRGEAVASPSAGTRCWSRGTYHSWYFGFWTVYGSVNCAPPSAGTWSASPVASLTTACVRPSRRSGKR